jgi:hypothetical protein
MMGTLAPPPAYGSERGSILLESAGASRVPATPPTPPRMLDSRNERASHSRRAPSSRHQHKSRRRELPPTFPASSSSIVTTAAGAASALGSPSSTQPIRPSPLRHSRQASNLSTRSSASNSEGGGGGGESGSEGEDIRNPPTPGLLDISLHSLHRFPMPEHDGEDDDEVAERSRSRSRSSSAESSNSGGSASGGEQEREQLSVASGSTSRMQSGSGSRATRGASGTRLAVSPPAYHPIDPNVSRHSYVLAFDFADASGVPPDVRSGRRRNDPRRCLLHRRVSSTPSRARPPRSRRRLLQLVGLQQRFARVRGGTIRTRRSKRGGILWMVGRTEDQLGLELERRGGVGGGSWRKIEVRQVCAPFSLFGVLFYVAFLLLLVCRPFCSPQASPFPLARWNPFSHAL